MIMGKPAKKQNQNQQTTQQSVSTKISRDQVIDMLTDVGDTRSIELITAVDDIMTGKTKLK